MKSGTPRVLQVVCIACIVVVGVAEQWEPITADDITRFAQSLPVARRTLDQSLNEIDRLLAGGEVDTFRRAQREANATDAILDHLDRITSNETKFKRHQLAIRPNVVVQTFHFQSTQIVGLALHTDPLLQLRAEELYANESATERLQMEDFVAAVHFPAALRAQIIAALGADAAAVVTAFLRDSLFVDAADATSTTPAATANGIVFSVLVPEFVEPFRAPVTITYKVRADDAVSKHCAHWLYGGAQKGSWRRDHLAAYCGGGYEVCEYHHLTHFGLLLSGADDGGERGHQTALDAITFVGCLLSVVGIFGILLTAALFAQWRANKGNVVLANYAGATLLEIVLLYAAGRAKAGAACDLTWCYWCGVALHYVVLAQFAWVLVISYLQYARYVRIFGADLTTNLLLKACAVGWLAPAGIVAPLAIFASGSYANSFAAVCYPSGIALLLGVVLPILICVLINIVVFVLIVRTLYAAPQVQRNTHAKSNQALLKFRLLVVLFFQLGISWVFGFLGKLHIAFVYIFCLTATLQGFFVFLLFIVLNRPTRMLYVRLVRGGATSGGDRGRRGGGPGRATFASKSQEHTSTTGSPPETAASHA